MTLQSSFSARRTGHHVPEIQSETYPADLLDREQWLTWKPTADGRKIPRAPYRYSEWPSKYVDAHDKTVWTDFETAQLWCGKLDRYDLAFTIRDRDQFPEENLILIDYDSVRDPATGRLHPTVWTHIKHAASYADISPSQTGVHILGRGKLPGEIRAISDSLDDTDRFTNAEIEVYDSARYIAMTGAHVANTPLETRNCQGFIEELAENFATTSESSFDHGSKRAEQSREPTDRVETTSDIEDIYHAIRRTQPGDLRLWSPVTEERNDGTKSRDPVWANSKTGTRLAEVDDVWIYRDGLIALDALQVVALEERIITDEQDYPSGRDFWRALDTLRARGADIPEYEADPDQVDASDHPNTSSSDARSLRALHRQLRAKTRERDELRAELTTLQQDVAACIRDIHS